MAPATTLRVARPCSDLAAARRFYCDALGLAELASFADHAGFDGLMVGEPDAAWHLELTCEHGAPVARPSPEDLLVLYEPDPGRYEARIARLRGAGCAPVSSHNPYWDAHAMTFVGPDGYRIVITLLRWRK